MTLLRVLTPAMLVPTLQISVPTPAMLVPTLKMDPAILVPTLKMSVPTPAILVPTLTINVPTRNACADPDNQCNHCNQ